MNEEPKSIWRRPRSGVKAFCFWLALFAGILFLAIYAVATVWRLNEGVELAKLALAVTAIIIIVAVVALGVCRFIRWLCCWRNLCRILFGVACLVTLIALAYVEENVRGKWAWEKFKREWEAKGERFDLASVIPPPVPDDQNFALAPIVASCYATYLDKNGHELQPPNTNVVDRLDMAFYHKYGEGPTNSMGRWHKSRLTDLKGWQQYYRALAATTNVFPVAPEAQTPAADVLLALSKYDSTIEELRQASRLPCSRFPLSYDKDDPSTILFPHFAALKKSAMVLHLRAVAELQNEQSNKALDDVKLMLWLVDSIRTEPFLISHLVRMAMADITASAVWEGLAKHRWSDAQLVELDREWSRLEFLEDYQCAMRSEMVLFQVSVSDYLRRHPERLFDLQKMRALTAAADNDAPPLLARVLAHLIPSGWFYQNQLRCARFMAQFFLPALDLDRRTMSPAFVRDAGTVFYTELQHPNPYNFLERLLLPALRGAVTRFATVQTSVDLARVACALERYRLAHGDYPTSLEVLAPQFIGKLPHDIIGGQPLKYRRTDDGQFVLYSIGWNETDDGGEVVLSGNSQAVNSTKGDWVWRYPAK